MGQTYLGAISFWTPHGLQKYINSELLTWHASVIKAPITVITTSEPTQILYSDSYQIICHPTQIHAPHHQPLNDFLNQI